MSEYIAFFLDHWLLSGLWLAVFALLIFSFVKSATSSNKSLNPQQVVEQLNRHHAQVIDIRGAGDFKKGHITGALNVPLSKIDSDPKLEKHKDKPIIVVCGNGMQSGAAVQKLNKAGFAPVHKLAGGMAAWTSDNLPLVKKK